MSEPDLFVVCKNCSAEVSPYVTECPYCGQRVRKRAPKIERAGSPPPVEDDAPPPPKARRQRSGRPKIRLAGEREPWVAPETRPYGVYTLIGLSLLATLLLSVRGELLTELGVVGPVGGDWWRLLTTSFLYDSSGYQFAALVATGVFGMHFERRFGAFAAVSVFLLAGVAGAALAVGLQPEGVALGANGAALGLLCGWLVDDRRAARRGEDRGSDMIGVAVFAAVLVLLSLASPSASLAAAAGGATMGALLGLLFSLLKR